MITKFKKNEMLFYLSYIMLYVSLFMGDIYNFEGLDAFSRSIRIFSYVLILFSCMELKLPKKDLILLIIILIITTLYGIKTGDLYWCIIILLIYNSKKADIKKIYKISFKIMMIGTVGVLLSCILGILPDILTSRDTVDQISFDRHSFGFYHSNVLPLLIFYLEAYYICITKEKARNDVIFIFMIIACIANFFCHSRNALTLSIFLSLSIYFVKRKSGFKILYRMTIFSIPCMSFFSVAMMFLLQTGGVWNEIDTFFTGRFRLAIFKMRRIGLHFINIMSNEFYINDNIVYIDGKRLDTIVIDNGYLYLILRYGILILLFYFLVAYLLAQKNKKSACTLVVLIAVFAANFVDNDLVDYSFLPFILWAFNDFRINDFMGKMKTKVIKIRRGRQIKL